VIASSPNEQIAITPVLLWLLWGMNQKLKGCAHQIPTQVRLSTPEWYIRSMPAMASDRIFCTVVASNVVHASFAGFTDLVIGRVNQVNPKPCTLNPKAWMISPCHWQGQPGEP
jgi:hypothetical protein